MQRAAGHSMGWASQDRSTLQVPLTRSAARTDTIGPLRRYAQQATQWRSWARWRAATCRVLEAPAPGLGARAHRARNLRQPLHAIAPPGSHPTGSVAPLR